MIHKYERDDSSSESGHARRGRESAGLCGRLSDKIILLLVSPLGARRVLEDKLSFKQWVRGSNPRRVTSIFPRAAMALGISFTIKAQQPLAF